MTALAPFFVAATFAILAAFVLLARPGGAINRLLFALLLLRGGSSLAYALLERAGGLTQAAALARASVWYALPVPLLTGVLLVLLFGRGHKLARAAVVAAAGATAAAALAFVLLPESFIARVTHEAGAAYRYDSASALSWFATLSFLIQDVAILVAAREVARADGHALERKRAALVGLAFATIAGWAGANILVLAFASGGAYFTNPAILARILSNVAGSVLAIVFAHRFASVFQGRARLAALAVAVVPVGVGALDGAVIVSASAGVILVPGYVSAYPLVQASFAFLLALAVVRYQLVTMSLAIRRLAARALVGVAFLGAGLLLVAIVHVATGEQGAPLTPLEALLVIGLALASQGVRALVDRVAERVFDVPIRGDRAATIEAYRVALAHATTEGRTPASDANLSALREELGLDADTANVIERMVTAAHARGPIALGEVVGGRYRALRLLGRGASGRAFLARDELLHRDVVLKEIPDDDAEGDAAALREARIAGSIGHPNVVTVHDVLRRAHATLLVVEHAPAGSLEARLRGQERMPQRDALELMDGVLAGLAAVHARGIVHRDLKPDNVLLGEDGTPKISDFGIARLRSGETARFDQADAFVLGTPGYMAPEQARGGVATPAVDVFAAGRMLARLFENHAPSSVAAVIERATRTEPAARWESAKAMRAALAEAAARLPKPETGSGAAGDFLPSSIGRKPT